MLIFLDFDGVLHPASDDIPDQVFCHLPRFEAIMRDFPMVEIVISSLWRYQFSLENLRARFSPDIAARIIATTPLTERVPSEYLPARRESEILDWLVAAGREGTPWIAIDDAAWQFQQHRDKLVACTWYIGLDEKAETQLRALLAENKESPC